MQKSVQLLFDIDIWRLDTVAFNGRPVWHFDERFLRPVVFPYAHGRI